MIIGYIRPLDEDQTCEKQINKLKKIQCDEYFVEKHSSAKNREELSTLIDKLTVGDTVVVTKLYVLADSTRHLVELLEIIEEKRASIHSLKEAIDTSKGNQYSFKYIAKHLVEFQSDVTSERTKRGLNKARQSGVIAGRPKKPDENVRQAIDMYQSKKYTLAEIREKTGISKSTLYRYLEQ